MTQLRVGSTVSYKKDVCKDPDSCPVCSRRWNYLTPMEQLYALANMKHSPHLRQLHSAWNYRPLKAEELQSIKERYQRTPNKPVRMVVRKEKLDWDDYFTEEDYKQIDKDAENYLVCRKMTEEYNKKPRAMLIDVGEQSEKEMNNYEAASVLLSMRGIKKE